MAEQKKDLGNWDYHKTAKSAIKAAKYINKWAKENGKTEAERNERIHAVEKDGKFGIIAKSVLDEFDYGTIIYTP